MVLDRYSSYACALNDGELAIDIQAHSCYRCTSTFQIVTFTARNMTARAYFFGARAARPTLSAWAVAVNIFPWCCATLSSSADGWRSPAPA